MTNDNVIPLPERPKPNPEVVTALESAAAEAKRGGVLSVLIVYCFDDGRFGYDCAGAGTVSTLIGATELAKLRMVQTLEEA